MANIFFATTGNDLTGTGSNGNPYATGTRAIADAVAGDTVIAKDGTYDTQVVICNGKVGTQANPITIKAENEGLAILKGKTNTLYCVDINNSDWITIQDFGIQLHAANSPDKKNDHAMILRGGSTHLVVDNCSITQIGLTPTEAAMQANYTGGWRSNGIAIRANVAIVEVKNCLIGGFNKGISSSGVVDAIHIHHNIIQNCVQSNVHWSSGEVDVPHHHLVEDNVLDYSFMEDGMQTIPDPAFPDGTTYDNVQVLFRRNVVRYMGENNIDTKGAAQIFIEKCIFYGMLGSNNGRLDTVTDTPNSGAPNQIVCGANQITKHRTMIDCICYDNNGGMTFHDYDNLINCTFWFNRRNYTGSETGTDATKFIAANFTESSANPVIIVNNFFGRSYAGVGIRTAGNQGVHIDYNAYCLNDKVGKNNTSGDVFDGSAEWKGFLSGLGFVTGDEAHSVYTNGPASALWTNVPERPTDTHDNYDFTIRTTSPCYQTGGHVTTTALAGTNTTSVKLTNPYPFRGNWGRTDVEGHTIFIEGCGARVIQDIDYDTQIAVLTQSGSWTTGAKVYMGDTNTPNIGSAPFGESGGGGGGGGEVPVDITLVGTPITVSTTALATLTITGFAPAAHELALVAVMTRNNTVPHLVTGGGLTWVAVESVIMEGTNGHLTLWRAMSQTTPAGGDLTITAVGNTTSFMAVAWVLAGVNQEGTNGSGAIEVAVTDNGPAVGASNLNMKLPITTLSDNAWALAIGSHRSTTFTVPAGETAITINNSVGATGASTISISVWYEVTITAGTVTLGADNDISANQWWVMIVVGVKPNTDTGPVVVDMSATFSDCTSDTVDPVVTAGGIVVPIADAVCVCDTVDPVVTIGQTISMANSPSDCTSDTVDPYVFSQSLAQIACHLRHRPLVLTLRPRGRNMFSREIVESPWGIGEDEIWGKPIDTTTWGGSPTNPVCELKEILPDGTFVDIALGAAATSGNYVLPPPISGLTAGKKYRFECRFQTGGETLEAFGYILCTE